MKLSDLKPLNEMTYTDAINMEVALFNLFKTHMNVKFTSRKHVRNRLLDADEDRGRTHAENPNDNARDVDIDPREVLDVFRKLIANKKGKILGFKQEGRDKEFAVIDKSNDLNIVFKIDFSRRPPEAALVTVIRKKNFKPSKATDTVYYV